MPVRPGDFPAADVKDFDAKAGTIFLSTKDHPRHAKLAPKVVDLLREHVKGRKSDEPLFSVGNTGKRWHRNDWREAILKAAQEAHASQEAKGIPIDERVPLEVSMYDLRHSAITDLIESGVSIAQVAFIAATSIAMIDANYRKALASVQKSALDSMADAIIA
jgi:integrase